MSEPINMVGIDPSLTNCGAAILTSGGELRMKTGELLEILQWLKQNGVSSKSGRWLIVMEHPGLDRPTFNMERWITSSKNNPDFESVVRRALKIAQDAGQSSASAKMWQQIFRQAKLPVYLVAPSTRDRADKMAKRVSLPSAIQLLSMPTKTTAAQFETLLGYNPGRCSEHARDAATLIWGKSQKWAEGRLKAIAIDPQPELF